MAHRSARRYAPRGLSAATRPACRRAGARVESLVSSRLARAVAANYRRRRQVTVAVVPPPPHVRVALRPTLGAVLPLLLPAVRDQVEEAERRAKVLDPASERLVGVEDPFAVAQEHAKGVVLAVADGGVEVVVEVAAVRRVPGRGPTHPLLVGRQLRVGRA